MGSGDKNHHHHHHHLINFHLHFHHHHHHQGNGSGSGSGKKENRNIPKGCLAIMVGQGEEQQRFVIPVIYINHPLFMQLLKEAEEEYGFHHNGPINIPCHVEEFRHVQGLIDKENSQLHHHSNNNNNHHHNNHHAWCFKA